MSAVIRSQEKDNRWLHRLVQGKQREERIAAARRKKVPRKEGMPW